MRVFLGLTEVSGYYSNLKQGFDEIGVDAELVSLYNHPFSYRGMSENYFPRFARICVEKRLSALKRNNFLEKKYRLFWVIVSRMMLFFWAIARFDVFIMGGGSSFFNFHELPILKLLGKKVFYIFHGTDARPAYIDGFCDESSVGLNQHKNKDIRKFNDVDIINHINLTKARYRAVKKIEKYCNASVALQSYAHFFYKPAVSFLAIGLPQARTSADVQDGNQRNSIARILHCPSHPEGKGTLEIRNALHSLKQKGLRFEYVEIHGRPNSEVLEEIRSCDFVIDQAFSDSPMAGFATEAAIFGKPAVVGGYYASHISHDVAPNMIPPSLFCLPEQLEVCIEKMIVDESFRLNLGKKAQEFVQANWSATRVARKYLDLIENNYPKSWLFDPQQTNYLHGIGLDEKKVKLLLRRVLEVGGVEALCLEARPKLKKMFLDLSKK